MIFGKFLIEKYRPNMILISSRYAPVINTISGQGIYYQIIENQIKSQYQYNYLLLIFYVTTAAQYDLYVVPINSRYQ